MQGLVFEGPGVIRHATDLADPDIEGPGDAIVQVLAAGLCGSDLHPYLGREPARAGVVAGHEVVGRVVAVGAGVRAVAEGDRVIVPFTLSCGSCDPCRRALSSRCDRSRLLGWGDPDPSGPVLHGGQAQYVRVPMAEGSLVAIGGGISALEGLLLSDNLPTGWYAALRGGVTEGSRVAVIGLGAVGLCAVASCLALGAAEVLAIDPVAQRREGAAALGAVVAEPDLEGDGLVDVAIDAAGPDAAQRLAARLVRPGGSVSLIAVQTAGAFAIDPVTAYDRNLTITAGRAPVRSLLDDLLPRIAQGSVTIPVDAVITHPGQPLAEGPALYRRFADRADGLVKAVFAPNA
ncbi:MAG TPA: alcohol dehydrogenase catalytic domain-containing protein [Euzebya sp.]|nr:alcohol dehydrogenase catalytic domain-containing protein [Euzebya sp.]